jgi:hypothetical protein
MAECTCAYLVVKVRRGIYGKKIKKGSNMEI